MAIQAFLDSGEVQNELHRLLWRVARPSADEIVSALKEVPLMGDAIKADVFVEEAGVSPEVEEEEEEEEDYKKEYRYIFEKIGSRELDVAMFFQRCKFRAMEPMQVSPEALAMIREYDEVLWQGLHTSEEHVLMDCDEIQDAESTLDWIKFFSQRILILHSSHDLFSTPGGTGDWCTVDKETLVEALELVLQTHGIAGQLRERVSSVLSDIKDDSVALSEFFVHQMCGGRDDGWTHLHQQLLVGDFASFRVSWDLLGRVQKDIMVSWKGAYSAQKPRQNMTLDELARDLMSSQGDPLCAEEGEDSLCAEEGDDSPRTDEGDVEVELKAIRAMLEAHQCLPDVHQETKEGFAGHIETSSGIPDDVAESGGAEARHYEVHEGEIKEETNDKM